MKKGELQFESFDASILLEGHRNDEKRFINRKHPSKRILKRMQMSTFLPEKDFWMELCRDVCTAT